MGTRPGAAHRSYQVAPAPPPAADVAGEPAPDVAGAAAPEPIGSIRTYRAPGRALSMPNATALRDRAREQETVRSVPVRMVVDDAVVSGGVAVSRQGPLRYQVLDDGLTCDRDMRPGCPHMDEACESVRAVLESRNVRSGLADLARARRESAGPLAADHEASEAAPAAAGEVQGSSSWEEDASGFQAAYREARRRRAQGEAAVPFMTEEATGGLGARNGGRGFGVEMEFDIDPSVNRSAALQAIARDLYAEGLIPSPYQTGYHQNRGNYTRWRFEHDATVDGEIVSPIMYDEPQSWGQLARVCEIVRRHGGRATARTGGHVHVGVADYDHTVENHARLLSAFKEHEDTLYRLAQNPERRAHRGTQWCSPNMAPAGPYVNTSGFAARNSSHGLGMNFEGAHSGGSRDHVEFRMWDSSLDPGVIQTQVKLSLGMTQSALDARRRGEAAGPAERLGTHRVANASLGRGGRLRGEAWQRDTRGVRRMLDRVFSRDVDKAQASALFAVTRWQRNR